MKFALKAGEMKAYDRETIEKIGIPSLVLMERAALATVEELEKYHELKGNVLVVAGSGNNGGDGFAIGRMLAVRGISVTFLLVGDRDKVTAETDTQIRIIENLGFSIQSKPEKKEYDIIIDALFGIGLGREVEGKYRELIEMMNQMKQRGAYVCSVDIPSGICADTGKVLGCAVKSDLTVSYGFAKRGHLLYPGKSHTGMLKVRDIGIPQSLVLNNEPAAFYYESREFQELLPRRQANGNKGTFGKVLLFAGSYDMCGACLVCGESILRTGAGMVKILSPVCNREIIQKALPEAMLQSYDNEINKDVILNALKWADVLVAGPGIGKSKEALQMLRLCLENSQIPTVLDADALNLLSTDSGLKELIRERGKNQMILTPHPGELVRLLQKNMEDYHNSREELIDELIDQYECTVVAKDAVTLVAGAQRRQLYMNTSGNDGMATAGSGDALAGMIGGLLAQGMGSFDAATLGVFLHGMAGDAAARAHSRYGVMATDIVKEIPVIMNQL